MSYRDLLKMEHPDCIDKIYFGWCRGCPGHYWNGAPRYGTCGSEASGVNCSICWDSEVPDSIPTPPRVQFNIDELKKEKKEMKPRNFSSMATMAEAPLKPVEQCTSVCGTMHDLYAVLASISLTTDGLAEILYAVPGNCEKPPEPSCLEDEVRLALELALSIRNRLEEIRVRL